jgi:hypothetical protein
MDMCPMDAGHPPKRTDVQWRMWALIPMLASMNLGGYMKNLGRGMKNLGGAKRRMAIAATAVCGVAIAAPPAQAGLLVETVDSCNAPVSKPFAKFGDYADYKAVPGGSFEVGDAAWKLSRASIVSGNESYYVRKSSDRRSLKLTPLASATSPAVCVGLEHPTLRYFVRSSGLLPLMEVEVLAETELGLVVPVPIGLGLLGSSWKPGPRHLIVANLLPLLPDNYTPVAFRFRAISGTWYIDDVYVDPKRRG